MKISRLVVAQVLRFGIVGVLNTAVDAIIYVILRNISPYLNEHFLVAGFISFCVATLHSFVWNKYWTFKDAGKYTHKQLLSFYTMSSVSLCVNQILLYVATTAGFHTVGSKIIASIGASGVNFVMQKFGTFRKKRERA